MKKRMDNCFDILANYKAGSIERHSDSTDFEETLISPRLSAKGGKHSLLESTSAAQRKVSQITSSSIEQKQHMYPNSMIYDNIPVRDYDVTDSKYRKVYKKDSTTLRARGDHLLQQETFHPKVSESKPYFSNILKRSNHHTKQMISTKDTTQDNLNNGKSFCPDCERRRVKKLNRCRQQTYVVQPVYAVENIHGGPVPFGHANDRAPLSQHIHKATRKQTSNTSYELTSSESENGHKNERKQVNHRRNFIDRFQKEMRKEYIKYEKELIRSRVQQYPSKRAYNTPYNVFSNPYCQSNCNNDTFGNQGGDQSKIPSTSSGFWEYLFEKIRGRRQTERDDSKSCSCPGEGGNLPQSQPPLQIEPCSPENCENFFAQSQRNNYNNTDSFPECKSCMQQTDNIADFMGESTSKLQKGMGIGKQDKKNGRTPVICKCNSNKRRQSKPVSDRLKNPRKSLTQLGESGPCKTCQEPHDDIAKTLEEKYNGEILCIHNPPCILINGCLNLPETKRTPPVQGNFWPVTQDKKSSFYHICRKMKRPRNCEQACQYNLQSIDMQRAMQIKTEKLVQSICNHNPPCQIVYGCYKAKYDPKLDNSCVHVPMCQRLPQCLIEGETRPKEDTKEGKSCEHNPKCNEVPLCSRKFVILTAKGTVGTQVRPKSKLVCRHEPPCIMIPKCLARVIADSYLPCDAIPDCVHQPCCEMIPACCRKAAKEMEKLPSLEDGISLKLPRAPVSHRNRIIRAIKRSQKVT